MNYQEKGKKELSTLDNQINVVEAILHKDELSVTAKSSILLGSKSKENEIAVVKRKLEKDEEPQKIDTSIETKLGKFDLDVTETKDVSVEIDPQNVDIPIKVIGGVCDKATSEKGELLTAQKNNIFENVKTEKCKPTKSEIKVFETEKIPEKNVVIAKEEVIQLDTKLVTGVEQKNKKQAATGFQFISNSDIAYKLSDTKIAPYKKLPCSSKLAEMLEREYMHSIEGTEHNMICVTNSSEEKNEINGVRDTEEVVELDEITEREKLVTTASMNTTDESNPSQSQITKYEIVTSKANGILITEEEDFKPNVIDKCTSPLTKRKHEETKNVHEAYRTEKNEIENGRILQTHFDGKIKGHGEGISQTVVPRNTRPFVSGSQVSDTTVLPLTSATLQKGTPLIVKDTLLKDITHYNVAVKETVTNEDDSTRDIFARTTIFDDSKITPTIEFSTQLADSEDFKKELIEAIETITKTTDIGNVKNERVTQKKGKDEIPTTMFRRYQEIEQVVSPEKVKEFPKLKEESKEEFHSKSCQKIYIPLESELRRSIPSNDQNVKRSQKTKTQHSRNDEASQTVKNVEDKNHSKIIFHSELTIPQEKQVNCGQNITGKEEKGTKENDYRATYTGRENANNADQIAAIKIEEKYSLTRQVLSLENNLPEEEKEADECNKNNEDQSVSTTSAKGKTGKLMKPKHEEEIILENIQRKDKEAKFVKTLELKSYLSHFEELKTNISEPDISQPNLIKDNKAELQDKTHLYEEEGKIEIIMTNEHRVGESTTSLSKEEIIENKLETVKPVKEEIVLAGPIVEDEKNTFDKEHPITEESEGLEKETKSKNGEYRLKLEENQPSNVTDLNNAIPSRVYNIEYKISKGHLVALKEDKTLQKELIAEPTPFNVLQLVPDTGVEKEATEAHLKEKSSLLLLTEDVYISIKPLEMETVLTNIETMNKQPEQSRERTNKLRNRREDKLKSVAYREGVPQLVIDETKSGQRNEIVSELESEMTIPKLNEEEEMRMEEIIQNTTGTAKEVSFNRTLSVSSTKGSRFKEQSKDIFKTPTKSRPSRTPPKTFYKKDVPTPLPAPSVNTSTSPIKIPNHSPERMPIKNGILSPNKVPARLPPIKAPVGQTPKPNLKNVKSKIDSFTNIKYKPTGGEKKQLLTKKLDWIAAPKVGSLENSTYKPGGGTKKITYQKLEWKVEPKVGTKNIGYTPGGGQVKIESRKLEWKQASSKVGSMDNVKHKPGGGQAKIKSHKLNFKDKVLPKVGSLSSSEKTSSQGSETKSPVPSSSPQPDEQPPLPPVDEPQGDEQPEEITEAGEQEADVTEQEPETTEGPEPEAEEAAPEPETAEGPEAEEAAPEPEESKEPAPEEATEEPTVEQKEEEEATEEAQTEITEESAPEATEEAPPETEEEAAPETEEEAAPETTEEAASEAVEETAPEATEETAPDATEEAAPEATEEAAPESIRKAAPDTTESDAFLENK
ncbi:microtubule-associated protein 2-like isoform X2 [Limulus polyphemus]|uniref:Microtubule-associated protein n=1 Tax=Limulus polyphemus TaxID=6850 RepID=A0ABM1S835_LIMPO|nr:microtubule-associated protein 2-like isoform X2 [Limulus polyphemus]